MYAIVKTGGKQYKVAQGDVVEVEKLDVEAGTTVELDVIFLADGSKITAAANELATAKVFAEVVEHFRGDKALIFKFKKRKGYKRLRGHRQDLTRLLVREISPTGVSSVKKASKKKLTEDSAAEEAKSAANKLTDKDVKATMSVEEVPNTKTKVAPEKETATKKPVAKKPSSAEPVDEKPSDEKPVKSKKEPSETKTTAKKEAAVEAEAKDKVKPAAKKAATEKKATATKTTRAKKSPDAEVATAAESVSEAKAVTEIAAATEKKPAAAKKPRAKKATSEKVVEDKTTEDEKAE
jgi:large subunit ribosomal protein L21